MRITNSMITNNTLRNVNRSKTNLSEAENQLATEKKITRPSDDPIVAIRALSLRSSLSEITMYLKNNIPEARSWIQVTESALDNMDSSLSEIYDYCTQGASDQFTINDRSAIIDVLKQYKNMIYSEANTNYAGRYCFTGYRTDSSFTFMTDAEADRTYKITQTFKGTEISSTKVMINSVDEDNIGNIPASKTPETKTVNRLRLAYEGCASTGFGDIDIDGTTYTPQAVSYSEFQEILSSGTFDSSSNTFYYVYDTGEILMTDDLYTTVKDAENISFEYTKEGFTKEDYRPEMYFNCEDITDVANPVTYTQPQEGQIISYNINFGQMLQVNTLGKDTISYDIGRDIDDMCNALQRVDNIEKKMTELKKMLESDNYSTVEKEDIQSMIDASEKELDYAKDNMEKLFSAEMTKVKNYQEIVGLQVADVGARATRLTLTESRLTEQQTTFKDLKSDNEDADLEETVVNNTQAKALYQAALSAAAGCVKQSLLDYI